MAKLQLSQCNRCKAYTLAGDDNGVRFAVDVAATDRDGYIRSIIDRRARYDVRKGARGGQEARARPIAAPAPAFTPEGAQEPVQGVSVPTFVHVEHGCGAGAKDQTPVKVAVGPPSAPVTPGEHRGGPHQPDAPASASGAPTPRSPAPHVTHHLSSAYQSFPGPSPQPTPQRPSETAREDRKRQEWPPSSTASAGSPGAAPPAPTAPAATRPSAPTWSATGTESANSVSAAGAQTLPASASSTATAFGVDPRPTGRSTDPYPKCGTCQRYIKAGESYSGIQHGALWIMAEHEECP